MVNISAQCPSNPDGLLWSLMCQLLHSPSIPVFKLTFSRVVIASVAILRLTSVIRFSRSKLHVVTDMGCVMATLFNVRTAANLRVGRGELRNSCSTVEQVRQCCKHCCNAIFIISRTYFISASHGLDTRFYLLVYFLPEIAGHRSLDLRFFRFTRARAAS